MDFCPKCKVATDVRREDGKTVYLCRNPLCEDYKKIIEREGENADERK